MTEIRNPLHSFRIKRVSSRRFFEIIVVVGVFAISLLSGCISPSRSRSTVRSDFGHRIEGVTEGRRTIVITPINSADGYDVSIAPYDDVEIRVGSTDGNETPVELLIKGALPDSCTELHGVRQTRTGNEVIINLQSRRPRGALCATVLRPYRFYLAIEGRFKPGRYTLDLNGRRQPFEIR